MWAVLMAGGYTMVPLFICSVLIAAIVIEKAVVLKEKNSIPKQIVNKIRSVVGGNEIDVIEDMCDRHPSFFSEIIKKTISKRHLDRSENQEHTQMEGKIQAQKMQRGMVVLEMVAAIAPLLGLLGTVVGLMDVFFVVAKVGVGQTAAFSSGIAKALITTVVGLIIAIPAFVANSYFTNKIENLVVVMEQEATELIQKIYK